MTEKTVDDILKRYSLKRKTAKRYIEAATMGNGKETAERIGVSRRTISNYKDGFAAMSEEERITVIRELAEETYRERSEVGSEPC